MNLGPFSLSLAVADLGASRSFYERLGFTRTDGDDTTWVLLTTDGAKIGLFQDMFDRNTLTFNPPDVREVQRELKAAGAVLTLEADDTTGPAHVMLLDPDGNPVLIDQIS